MSDWETVSSPDDGWETVIEKKLPSLSLLDRAGQYASGAIESGASLPSIGGMAGMAIGGPVGGLIGAGLGSLPSIAHAIAPNYVQDPNEWIKQGLLKVGVTQSPAPDAEMERYVGGITGFMAPQQLMSNVTTGAAKVAPTLINTTLQGLGGYAGKKAGEGTPYEPLTEMAGLLAQPALASVYKSLTPTSRLATHYAEVSKDQGNIAAQQGQGLSGKGQFLTIGQETADPRLLGSEARAAMSPRGRVLANIQYDKSVQSAERNLEELTKGFNKPSFGQTVVKRFKNTVGEMYKWRSEATKDLYAPFNDNVSRVPADNFKSAIAETTDMYSLPEASLKKAHVISKLFGDTPPTVSMLHDARVKLGEIARGNGSLFPELGASNRRIARDLATALNKDIESAGLGPQLDIANAEWKRLSQPIDQIAQGAFAKVIKSSGSNMENLTEGMLRMHPSQLKQAIDVADLTDPMMAKQLRQAVFSKMLIAGQAGGRLTLPGTTEFNVRSALTAIPQRTKDVIFNTPQSRDTLRFISDSFRHVDLAKVSTQAPLNAEQATQEAAGIIGGLIGKGSLLGTQAPVFMARYGFKTMTPGILSKILFTEEGQQAVKLMAQQKGAPDPDKVRRATLLMTKALMSDQSTESDQTDVSQ